MSLPEAFDKHLFRALNARAVWLPGKPVQLGDVLVRSNDQFRKVAHLSNFGATVEALPHSDTSLDLTSAKVTQRLFQAGVELPGTGNLDLAAEASVRFEFTGGSQFVLKTPTLSGTSVQNLLAIAGTVAGLGNWKHDKFFIVHELYTATDWSFLGTKENSASFEFAGNGAAILSFVTAGASFGLRTAGTIDVKILGQGGAIGMNVARVKKDGSLTFDL